MWGHPVMPCWHGAHGWEPHLHNSAAFSLATPPGDRVSYHIGVLLFSWRRNVAFTPTCWRAVRHGLLALAGLFLLGVLAPADTSSSGLGAVPRANYKLALKYSSGNLAPMTYSTGVFPGWIGKSDSFWYSYRTSK